MHPEQFRPASDFLATTTKDGTIPCPFKFHCIGFRDANPPRPPDLPVADSKHTPIVAIGASAGGLEAIEQLLRALPGDTGMGFVVVQHLSPTHTSMLAEILGRWSPMPVVEVKLPAVESESLTTHWEMRTPTPALIPADVAVLPV